MLAKAESENKILVKRIKYDKKTMEVAKKKVSTNVQMFTIFITSLIITN
jgi:hypothetical protein